MSRIRRFATWLNDEPWRGAYVPRGGLLICLAGVPLVLVVACSSATATPVAPAVPGATQSLNVTIWEDPDPNVNVRCYHYGEWSCVNLGGGTGLPPDSAIPTLPPLP